MIEAYRWLMGAPGWGDPFDRHLFACTLAVTQAESSRPLAVGLGLSAESLAALVGLYFPHAPGLLAGLSPLEDGHAPMAIEEEPLRALMLANRAGTGIEEEWLSHMVARRCILSRQPLWEDMGLAGRDDVTAMMERHFPGLAAANSARLPWKRFLYDQFNAMLYAASSLPPLSPAFS